MNLYKLVQPLLFKIDAETTHEIALAFLKRGMGPKFTEADDPSLKSQLGTLTFSNPVGLAAGLDKQASAISALLDFGFGFTELGGVTPRPQTGNPRPRLFRVPEAKAIINRFGFNSVGADVFAERLKNWRETGKQSIKPVGVNLGKNKDTQDDAADYIIGLEKIGPYADFVTINVSSPNTQGLRDLQSEERLNQLIMRVLAVRDSMVQNNIIKTNLQSWQRPSKLPVFVKLSPDLTEQQREEIAALSMKTDIAGLIIGNTTLTRPASIPPQLAQEMGGLSGPPLFQLSTAVLADFYKLTKGRVPLIGCGGISNGLEAYEKIKAGASLVQIYTSLIYEGPQIVGQIKKELTHLLKRDRFKSVSDAVGTGVKF